MMNLHLLIIEDDEKIISDWTQKLELYSVEDNPVYSISHIFSRNLEDAKNILRNGFFDAAVIDIRLAKPAGDGNPNKHGNELFSIITTTSLAVTAVYTGEPEIVELDESQKELVKVFKKGEGDTNSILKWLDEKYSMISAIQNMQRSLNMEMAKAFSKSIWPRWNYWLSTETNNNPDLTHSALRRHMATHLHASFMNDESLGTHPEEYFFIPPLQDKLNTGDIIFHDGKLEIIVTPRCDMVRSKSATPTYQLALLLDKKEEWNKLEEKLISSRKENSDKKIRTATNELVKFTNHNGETGSHFIQKFRTKIENENKELGPFYVQFNQLRSMNKNEENINFLKNNRIASLSNEFVPSLVERLGSYFSRIGTPDYSHPD